MNKILHIFVSNGIGGAELLISNLIISNQNYHTNHTVLCRKGRFSDHLSKKSINFITYSNKIQLLLILNKYKSYIFHCHDPGAAFISSLIKNKLILHVHGNHKYMQRISLKNLIILFFILPKIYRILWISEDAFESFYFKNKVIYFSVVLFNFSNTSVLNTNNKPFDKRKYDLIFLGRMTEIKQPMKFILLVKNIVINKKIKCIMVGDGPLLPSIKKYIELYSLGGFIETVGFKENIYEYLYDSKILVNLSISEGFPITFIESAWSKVIISHTLGYNFLKSLLNNNNSISCENTNELQIKLLNLLKDDFRMNEIAEKNFNTFKDLYNSKYFTKELNKIYNDYETI